MPDGIIGVMSRPRILIPIPTSFDPAYNQKCWPEYAAAVTASGGDAVPLALGEADSSIRKAVDACAGILLPGSGADVNPSLYGHARDAASAEPDTIREQTDWALFDAAERAGKPLLAICFGTQSLNVYCGGTLIQDCSPLPVNHRAGRAVAAAHTAQIARESRLGLVLADSSEIVPIDDAYFRIPVNSSHHQAVAIAGDTLRVVARCPDDAVIEAVESADPDRWLVGLQWHPERTFSSSAASRAIFASFLSAAGA